MPLFTHTVQAKCFVISRGSQKREAMWNGSLRPLHVPWAGGPAWRCPDPGLSWPRCCCCPRPPPCPERTARTSAATGPAGCPAGWLYHCQRQPTRPASRGRRCYCCYPRQLLAETSVLCCYCCCRSAVPWRSSGTWRGGDDDDDVAGYGADPPNRSALGVGRRRDRWATSRGRWRGNRGAGRRGLVVGVAPAPGRPLSVSARWRPPWPQPPAGRQSVSRHMISGCLVSLYRSPLASIYSFYIF